MAKAGRSLLIAFASVLALTACGKSQALGAAGPGDQSLGNPKAKVTVAEYASASCPHCAEFNNTVFAQFKAKYIDTGKVNYVFHEFYTPPVPFAAGGFLVARCAGPGKYFDVLDAIFHGQSAIYASGDFRGGLEKIALSTGMSEKQFTDCIGDDKALKAMNARVQQAEKDGINSTPTFVINGTKIEGEQTMAKLDDAIAKANQ